MAEPKGYRFYGTFKSADGKLRYTDTFCCMQRRGFEYALIAFYEAQTAFVKKSLNIYFVNLTMSVQPQDIFMYESDVSTEGYHWYKEKYEDYYKVFNMKKADEMEEIEGYRFAVSVKTADGIGRRISNFCIVAEDSRTAKQGIEAALRENGSELHDAHLLGKGPFDYHDRLVTSTEYLPTAMYRTIIGIAHNSIELQDPFIEYRILKPKKEETMKIHIFGIAAEPVQIGHIFKVGDNKFTGDSSYASTIWAVEAIEETGLRAKAVGGEPFWQNKASRLISYKDFDFTRVSDAEFKKLTGNVVRVETKKRIFTETKLVVEKAPVIKTKYYVTRGNWNRHGATGYIVSLHQDNDYRTSRCIARFYGDDADEHLAEFVTKFLEGKEVDDVLWGKSRHSLYDNDVINRFSIIQPS